VGPDRGRQAGHFLIPFVIVGFEFTVLFAVFGNVIGLLTCMRLPDYKGLDIYDPRCSGEHFGARRL
jgi:molybdopterin-containing oxidoreductase family membrane subunit